MRPIQAKAELVRLGKKQRHVAERHGLSEHYLGRTLNGYVRPSQRVREILVAETGLTEGELFDDREPVST